MQLIVLQRLIFLHLEFRKEANTTAKHPLKLNNKLLTNMPISVKLLEFNCIKIGVGVGLFSVV
jgi:hypothetical protein